MEADFNDNQKIQNAFTIRVVDENEAANLEFPQRCNKK